MRSVARLLVALCLATAVVAADPQLHVVYTFDPAAGLTPTGPLLQRRDGSFVVAAHRAHGAAVLVRVNPKGNGRVIHEFDEDGVEPQSMIETEDGRVLGVTAHGAIFALDPTDRVAMLGGLPGHGVGQCRAWLTERSHGGIFGVATSAGTAGTIFRLESDGTVVILHQLRGDGSEGASPIGPLVEFPDGYFYGAVSAGGAHGVGGLYRVTPDGEVAVVHSFDPRTEGATPAGGIALGPGKSGFGVLALSAKSYAGGAIYRWNQDGSFSIVHDFAGAEGSSPFGELMGVDAESLVSNGLLAGATRSSGPNGTGTVYLCDTRRATTSVIYAFRNTDSPLAGGLIQGRDGSFYGVTTGDDTAPAMMFRIGR